jgi:YfiR/HmsC-like
VAVALRLGVMRSDCKRCWVWALFAVLLLLSFGIRAQQAAGYDVKAVFLFNFAQFVEWPAESFASPDSPIVIGVLGEDPFGSVLDQRVSEAPVKGRRIVVRRHERVEDLDMCHLLFINVRNAARLRVVISSLNQRATLTVGDAESFLEQGGMIQFFTQDNRIKLRINLDAATAAGLTLSSKLLRLAQIITTAGR